MRPPALGLAQHAAPGAGHRERRRLLSGVCDFEPSSQNRRAVEFGVYFDRDGSNRMLQSNGDVRVSMIGGGLLQPSPLPIRNQRLTVDFQTERLRHVIFGGIEPAVVEIYI